MSLRQTKEGSIVYPVKAKKIANALIGIFLGGAACASSVHAQWANQPDKGIPRLPDGKPNLAAPAPRAANGKPDLTGVWETQASEPGEARRVIRDPNQVDPAVDLQTASKYFMNIFADVKPADVPMRPEAVAILEPRLKGMGKDSPTTRCLPGGLPFSMLITPFKMIQTPVEVVVLHEDNNPPRQIYTDGRKLPADPDPSWMGYSVGQWQGETLVVDSTGFNDRTFLDALGHPHSESMHLVERYHRTNVGRMEIEVTVDDPKMYTRPFTVKFPARLIPDSDVFESVCAENERDRSHMDK
jgi:hypothetical protein